MVQVRVQKRAMNSVQRARAHQIDRLKTGQEMLQLEQSEHETARAQAVAEAQTFRAKTEAQDDALQEEAWLMLETARMKMEAAGDAVKASAAGVQLAVWCS